MSDVKLKPCPFCGGEGELGNYISSSIPHSSVAYVQCKKCGGNTRHIQDKQGNFEYMYKVVELWNRRADNG